MHVSRFRILRHLALFACTLAICAGPMSAATAPFEIVIDTTQSSVPGDTQFTLPLNPAETYDFTVDWGDSSTAAITTSSDQTHTYATAGVYTIAITENVVGGFPTYQNGTGTSNYLNGLKLMQIAAWGGNTWTTFDHSFYDCTNLVITATDAATAKTGTVTDFFGAWTGCSSLTSFPLLDTHSGTDFGAAWDECSGLTSFPLLSTAAGVSFDDTWNGCSGLTTFPNLNMANGQVFYEAWDGCTGLTTFPTLTLTSITDGRGAFAGDTLATADYSNLLISLAANARFGGFTFDGGNSKYNLAAAHARNTTLITTDTWTITDGGEQTPFAMVIDTTQSGTSGNTQFILPLNPTESYDFTVDWGDSSTTAVTTSTNQTHTYASAGVYTIQIGENVVGGFPTIQFGNGSGDRDKLMQIAAWGGNTWTTLNSSFQHCDNMTITATDAATALTGSVTDFSNAFGVCGAMTTFPAIDTHSGTDFSDAWADALTLTSFPLINTSHGTNFQSAWQDSFALTSFPLLDTSAGTNFQYAWSACTGLASFPLIDTSHGTDFTDAWEGCSGLTAFPLLNTGHAMNLYEAWGECSGLISFPLLDTHNCYNFNSAWAHCSALTSFPLINTGDIGAFTDFSYAWYGCTGLTSFPLIDTSQGDDFRYAWSGCTALTSFPSLNTAGGEDFSHSWDGCTALTSFPALNLGQMVFGTGAFSGDTLNADNYSNLLIAMAADNTNTGVPFDGGNSQYTSSASSARNTTLITALGWTITDGGEQPPTITSAATASVTVGTAFTYQIIATNAPTAYGAANLPAGLSCDATSGAITGTPTTVAVTAVTLSAINSGGTGTAPLTLTVLPQAPVITAPPVSTLVGATFTYQISASNAPTAYAAANLPAGLSVDPASGVITGIPTSTTTASVALSATNAGGTGNATLSLTVLPMPPVVTAASATTSVGATFTYQVSANGSPTAYGAENLPAGLSIDTTTGAITGTPLSATTAAVTLSATNAGGTGTEVATFTVLPLPPVITSATTATVAIGNDFSYAIEADNTPDAFGATGLPAGLTVDPGTGVISGVATSATTASITLTATNSGGTATATLTLTVDLLPPVITSATAATATVGTTLIYQIVALNGPTTYTAAPLPPGLTLNAANGLIFGTPTNATAAAVTIGAANAAGSATAAVTFIIAPQVPTITWATPLPITWLTPLSSTQLDANASVAGTFAYSPAAGAVLNAGTQILSATFTPSDPTVATTASATVALLVRQAVPVLTWVPPASITTGAPLTATQLGATANVSGTFTFDPPIGTVLTQGMHTLTVTFTPDDAVDYTTTSASVNLDIEDGSATANATAGGTTTTAVQTTGGGSGCGLGSGLALLGLVLFSLRGRRVGFRRPQGRKP